MQENLDRRIRRTNRALAAALIELTSERPYASIQVRDITDRADIGYATFYRHYDNKDDLMLAVFDDITEELETGAGHPAGDYFEEEGIRLFEHVRTYHGFYWSILQSQEFVQKLKNLLSRRIEEHMLEHSRNLNEPAFPVELAAHHMAISVIGLIEWWLNHKMSQSLDEMARIYNRLVIQSTWYAIDRANDLTNGIKWTDE